MLAVAARTGISELPQIGAAFIDADAASNGTISREEFVAALASASTCGWPVAEVDAGVLFNAADLALVGRLGFTEFAAACLYGRYGHSSERLAEQAFSAFDADRDGFLRATEVWPMICHEALADLAGLPQDRPIGSLAWLRPREGGGCSGQSGCEGQGAAGKECPGGAA